MQRTFKICLVLSPFLFLLLFTDFQNTTVSYIQNRVYPKPRLDKMERFKQTYSKETAFYGLAYLNLYGRPRSDFLDKGFEQKLEDWRVYFPELMTSLNKFNQRKQNTDFTLNTFSNSRVVIVDKRTEYKTGDILNARIDAYNWKENRSSFGGDYFVARLIYGNNTLYPDGIAGIVTDHRNGTYSIRVPLLIPGEARLEVKLMIPLEGISELIRCTSLRNYIGTQYQSEYETKEKTECNIDFSYTNMTADEICDYSNPRNQEPWFCVKPPSGKCPQITNVVYSWERSSLDSTYEKCRNDFVHNLGCNQVIHGPGLAVTVSPGKEIPPLPLCKTSLNWKTLIRPNGYFLNGAWKSTFCNNKLSSIAQARPCFENKDVYFLGDSTTRQFHYLIAGTLGMQSVGPQNGHIWQQPQTAGSGNIRFYYRAHGPPLQNPGPPNTRPYVSDMLDEIAPGENEVVVILNLGLHMLYFEPSFFIHRMRGIKDAMLRLNQRRANVRYIYRSHRVLTTNYGRDNGWLVYRYGLLTREIFKDVENFFYLDLWDLSSVWPIGDFHPTSPHLVQEAIYMCNFICNGI
ncbi:NXPE family member 2-like [Ciona intestinalis]